MLCCYLIGLLRKVIDDDRVMLFLHRVVDLGVQAAVKMYQTKIKDLQVERAKRKESVQEDADTKLAKLNSTDT